MEFVWIVVVGAPGDVLFGGSFGGFWGHFVVDPTLTLVCLLLPLPLL